MAGTIAPRSLKPAASAADRKAYAFTGTTAAPTLATDGFDTRGSRFVRLSFNWAAGGGGDTQTLNVWVWSEVAQQWALVDSIGSNGAYQVSFSGDTPLLIIETAGAPRVAVNCTARTGTFDVDVWLEGSTY